MHNEKWILLMMTTMVVLFQLEQVEAFINLPAVSYSLSKSTTRLWNDQDSKRLTIVEQLKLSPNRWKANGKDLEPGVGGIWPGKPDAKKYTVTVIDPKSGTNYTMDVPEDRYIYWAFEDEGIDLPMQNGRRMCRNGCCTTCAVKVKEGKVKMEAALGLLRDMKKKGYALTCCSLPRSDIVCELQDEDEVYIKQWGETFESGGVEWGGFLPEDD